ncbi:hypothetical protein QL285_017757 [Trifolium repens]|nr:hypothetical protein QL285_017757 [Trifolium repens]
MDFWQNIHYCALFKHNSDHHPLLVGQDLSGVKHPAPFHFFRAWISHADCVRVVKEVWAEPVHGSPMVCLQAKLKRLKAALKEWNLMVFGNMDHNVTSAIDEVTFVQALIGENGITDALQQRDFEAQLTLSKVPLQQEIFWREKWLLMQFCILRDCRSYEEGGLNIRSLRQVNDSLMLQRCWQFYSSNEHWAIMCRARFLKWGQPMNTFLKSSFWHGIKHHIPTMKANTRWIIGSGTEISFWLDNWLFGTSG